VILVRVQEHEEVLGDCPAAIAFIRQFVHRGLRIVNIDAFCAHPLVTLEREWSDERELAGVNVLRAQIDRFGEAS
jgi:hypothetical protein